MLYAAWKEIAWQNRSSLALVETATGCRWTFDQLARAAENRPIPSSRITFPKGQTAEFILDLLASWRQGVVTCPIESDAPPRMPGSLPMECCHLKSTSASTGPVRLVAFRAEQLRADARNIVATMGLRPDWPNLGLISLAHSYGFSNLILPLIFHGIPLVLVDAPLPERLKKAASGWPALTLPAVPALWRAWLDAGAVPENIRLAISAGAPLPVVLEAQAFSKCGLKIHNFYGSSECGGIAYDRTKGPRRDPALAGTALDGVHVSLDPDGCLEVRGEAVGATYWPEHHPSLAQGRFLTSDLARIEDDQIFLAGRASDLINVAGRKIAPESIERVLGSCSGVRDCVVFGVGENRSERHERIVAALELASDTSLDSVKQEAQQRLAPWQLPRQWWVTKLQPNSRGKCSRAELRSRYESEQRQKTEDQRPKTRD